ncbi:hypothetical protein AX16_005997 [Volvariella volvacea WC 439]|nr:hypothetical protein AX16_005997 [Volvariella volvacea WC 439]
MAPELPCELEREIFQLVVQDEIAKATTLVLVARRVKQWLDPILYRSVTLPTRLSAAQFLHALTLTPSLSAHVQSLTLSPTLSPLTTRLLLSKCAHLTALACFVCGPRLRPHLLALTRIQRLAFMPSALAWDCEGSPSPDFGHAFYERATHVQFLDRWAVWVQWPWDPSGRARLARAPNLTHVSFLYDDTAIADDGRVVAAVQRMLDASPRLCVFVLLCTSYPFPEALAAVEDARFVLVGAKGPRGAMVRNWEAIPVGDGDIWTFAEGVVRSRVGGSDHD